VAEGGAGGCRGHAPKCASHRAALEGRAGAQGDARVGSEG